MRFPHASDALSRFTVLDLTLSRTSSKMVARPPEFGFGPGRDLEAERGPDCLTALALD
ncbi:hypothetical protein [Bradyrhizobium sp. CCGB01]|uniref:hypothetical protein n=1 Tax=Bradyrhizobium sp. CCGB01 TaxID=2949634 RepID=UPI0020B405E1|nr:hypothetical protein [Bradyrhizobium sp. CCGB01]MCP3409952.1 hypothetical protein [Bradyrhizobium sp. CCGB01]